MPTIPRNRLTSAAKNARGLELGSVFTVRGPSLTGDQGFLADVSRSYLLTSLPVLCRLAASATAMIVGPTSTDDQRGFRDAHVLRSGYLRSDARHARRRPSRAGRHTVGGADRQGVGAGDLVMLEPAAAGRRRGQRPD